MEHHSSSSASTQHQVRSQDHALEDPATVNTADNSSHAVTAASLEKQRASTSTSTTTSPAHDVSGPSSISGSTSSSLTARRETPGSHGHGSHTPIQTQSNPSSSSSSNNKKKLAKAEAATAAALAGDSPSLSSMMPSATLAGNNLTAGGGIDGGLSTGGGGGRLLGSISSGSSMNMGGAKAGEGTITNTSATGPPTPSATRLPFLPSALKKSSAFSSNGKSPSSSSHAHNDGHTSLNTNEGRTSIEGQSSIDSSSSKKKRDKKKENKLKNTSSNPATTSPTSMQQTIGQSDDPDVSTTSNTSNNSINAYEKLYNASAAKVRSKREREEAREERETERLYGSSMPQHPQPPSPLSSGGGGSMMNTSMQMGNSSGHVNMNAQQEGWPLNHTTKGTGIHSRPGTANNNSNNGNGRTTSSNSQPVSLGFASPHMSPALLEAGQGRFPDSNNGRINRGSNNNNNNGSSSSSYLNISTSNMNDDSCSYPNEERKTGDERRRRDRNRNKTAAEIKEEEENELAAKLGGGIGPTTSRIKKSTKKAPSSPNNVQGEKEAAAAAASGNFEKEQRDYLSSKKSNNKSTLVSVSAQNRRTAAALRRGGGVTDNDDDDNDIEGGGRRQGKKDTQLQFSPKVRKPLNITWRAIKRKFLLASTGTPSSGEGSRRSETSETSGGSRHRMYVANPNAHAHGGEKQVHIQGMDDGLGQEDWEVDQVVVDNDWFDDEGNPILWGSSNSGSAANGAGNVHNGGGGGGSGEKGHHGSSGHHHSAGGERVSNSGKETTTNHSETAGSLIINPTIKAIDGVVTFFKGYLIPKCAYFFEPRFGDPEKELNFRKERWYNTKRNAAFGCFFLILNWVLLVALIKMQGLYQKLLYYGLLTLFVWPMPFFVAFDLPRKWPTFYSFWGMTAAMLPAFFGIISMYVCHFLRDGSEACNGQTFLTIHYYATAFAVVALFALHVNRLAAVISQLIYWIMTCVMLLPEAGSYARTAVNFLVFSAFIIYLHFQQEKIDRRMFTLRTQLKISYRALQKSQIAEKKAANSKKRFISYIFHEVRVPLNTAYLAFQNLQQSNGFNRQDEDQMVEVYALESSLQQVQQVLNDVLDLQRMDAGKFESSSQPFNFHRAINALVASLKVAATAKRLQLDVQLDEAIDNLPQSMEVNGQKASYVIGDEIRLRQVLTNIASNAVKFSREGRGGIKVRTKLIWPVHDDDSDGHGGQGRISDGGNDGPSEGPSDSSGTRTEWKDSDITPIHGTSSKDLHTPYADSEITFNNLTGSNAASGRRSSKERDIEKEAGLDSTAEKNERDDGQHHHQSASYPPSLSHSKAFLPRNDSDDSDASHFGSKRRKDFVIVRIEIEDNGPGIRPSDMVDQRLFSAYVQTEIGRVQGGKGSGLGLAIVRAIVQMTRGRLGVQSSKNGTTFWIEQRYHFATQQEVEALQALQDLPTPYSFNPDPLPKPVRPPVKPYKTGESSFSQYSGSRMEDGMAMDPLQSTPHSETERPLLMAALGGLPLPDQAPGSANMSAESLRAGSASISSLPSAVSVGNTSTVGTSSATNAMDVQSPLTSEQWSQNNVERSVMPTMSITAPTPPTATPAVAAPSSPTRSTVSTTGARMPIPSPSNSTASTSGVGHAPAPGPSRTFSDDAKSAISAAGSSRSANPSGTVPFESPVGEEAFTPMTRQVVTSPTPEGENPPVPESSRISPLPMPGPRSRPTSQASVPSVAASQASTSGSGPANTSSASQQQGERLTALVVDDDPLTRKLMSRMMTRLGCQVEDAENGQMFLDVALGNKEQGREPKVFDIVTLDNAMPVMTGEEAIKIFRRAGRKELVVGATGNALKGDQTSYLRAGVDTVLTKPISARDLTAQLNLARKRRQVAQEDAAAIAADASRPPTDASSSTQ